MFGLLTNHPLVRPALAWYLRREVRKKADPSHYPAPFALIDLWRQHGHDPKRMLAEEGRSVAQLITGETAQNLVRLFFLRERVRSWGRSSDFVPRHVHVVGAGTMGGDIAAWCALRGFKVTLQDRAPELIAPKRAYAQDFALIGCRDNKPTGIFWLYEIGFRLFGIYNISAVRWLQTAGLVIAAYFLYLTAKQSNLKSAGAWTASLFLLAMSLDQAMVAAKTEALAVLPMAVGAFAITKSVLAGKLWLCFVFGACAAAASLCKQPAGIVLVAGAIVVLVCTRDRRAKMLASIAAGFAVTYLLVIAVYTAKHGLSDFFLQVIELPSKYASIDRISLSRRLFRVLTYTEEYGRLTPVLSACGIGGQFLCSARCCAAALRIASPVLTYPHNYYRYINE